MHLGRGFTRCHVHYEASGIPSVYKRRRFTDVRGNRTSERIRRKRKLQRSCMVHPSCLLVPSGQ